MREKKWESEAERVKAYREKKKGLGKGGAKCADIPKGIEMASSGIPQIQPMALTPGIGHRHIVDPMPEREGEVGVVATVAGREAGWGSVGPHGDDGDGPRWGPGVPVYIPSALPQDEARIDPEGLNATDRTFAAEHPGRYVYGTEREEMCMLPSCMKKFKTRLALNRFCSYAHQQERLNSFNTMRYTQKG